MKTKRVILTTLVILAGLGTVSTRAAVAVGSSTLIDQLDYSDTFTLTANGGIAGRTSGAFPVGSPGIAVESSYGNPAQSWTDSKWSLADDSGGFVTGYPGSSGAGTATGFTQSGGAPNWGLEYGLRTDFIVQFDATQTTDRMNIAAGNTRDTISSPNGLTVFFRANGSVNPEVGLFNGNIGETSTGFDTGGVSLDVGEWHNYAVRFNLAALQLVVYVDQVTLGTLDLTTFAGGAYATYVNGLTDDAVSLGFVGEADGGGHPADVAWTDNFQVGVPTVPEPTTVLLLGVGGLWIWRRRKNGE